MPRYACKFCHRKLDSTEGTFPAVLPDDPDGEELGSIFSDKTGLVSFSRTTSDEADFYCYECLDRHERQIDKALLRKALKAQVLQGTTKTIKF